MVYVLSEQDKARHERIKKMILAGKQATEIVRAMGVSYGQVDFVAATNGLEVAGSYSKWEDIYALLGDIKRNPTKPAKWFAARHNTTEFIVNWHRRAAAGEGLVTESKQGRRPRAIENLPAVEKGE